jgi:serine/threonine protein kinase
MACVDAPERQAMAPTTAAALVELVRKSGLVEGARLDAFLQQPRPAAVLGDEPKQLAALLVQEGFVTYFQARQLLRGKWRGYTFGKYQVLEQLGTGRTSGVYLCQHTVMKRHVALKVLPLNDADDPAAVGRFHREARAAAALDHPNIVHAYDSGHEGEMYFIAMEYVDGFSLREIVDKHGPMDPLRAAHYVSQAAQGLQHVYESGLIHRDIKPGNLLLDRTGTVRVLDLGLARFFQDHQDLLTQQYDKNSILGTADYISPEQARDSHDVDIRTDIYSLGGTFYFLLTGRPPFDGKSITKKLLYHQSKEPTPIRELRPEVPEAMVAVVVKMMAKNPDDRYPHPAAVVEALELWTRTSIAPPAEAEMPRLCPAAVAAIPRKRSQTASSKVNAVRSGQREPVAVGNARVTVQVPGLAPGDAAEPASDTPTSSITAPAQAHETDTDPALMHNDTDPQLSRERPVIASPIDVTYRRFIGRRRKSWLLAGVVALTALLSWLLIRLLI